MLMHHHDTWTELALTGPALIWQTCLGQPEIFKDILHAWESPWQGNNKRDTLELVTTDILLACDWTHHCCLPVCSWLYTAASKQIQFITYVLTKDKRYDDCQIIKSPNLEGLQKSHSETILLCINLLQVYLLSRCTIWPVLHCLCFGADPSLFYLCVTWGYKPISDGNGTSLVPWR